MADLPLRPNVCMLVFNREKRLFLGERSGEPGIWQFPQGGIESGAGPEDSVMRELEEELGVNSDLFRIIRKLKAVNEYNFSRVPAYAAGKWRGQSQTFWLVEFLGEDADIDVSRFDAEFSNWKWCTASEVRKLAEPKRMAGYLEPLREFEEHISVR